MQDIIIWIAVGGAVAYLVYRRLSRRNKPRCPSCPAAKVDRSDTKHMQRHTT